MYLWSGIIFHVCVPCVQDDFKQIIGFLIFALRDLQSKSKHTAWASTEQEAATRDLLIFTVCGKNILTTYTPRRGG